MTRSQLREVAIHLSFAQGANFQFADELIADIFDKEYYQSLAEEEELYENYPQSKNERAYLETLIKGLSEHIVELDFYIEKYAQGWKLGRISRVLVAIMRVSMFEMLYMPDIPNSSSINDALEIAKKYEEPEAVSFLNGVLGSFLKGEIEGV